MQVKVDFQEQVKSKRVKSLIAREGLILLGIIGVGCLVINTAGLYTKPRPIRIEKATSKEKPIDLLTEKRITYLDTGERRIFRLSEVERAGERQARVEGIGLFILLLGYPVYLLIRFILWAIRTLKEK